MSDVTRPMRGRREFLHALRALPLLALAPAALAKEASPAAQRADIRKMANTTLRRLYKAQPGARQAIANASGYAVFSNFGMKLFFAGGGSGTGMVVNRQTRHETFMKMFELQAGIGFGIKRFSVIFVFGSDEALAGFVDAGWEFSGQGTAAAALDESGKSLAGAVHVAPDIWMYQLTDKGIALELTAKGTRYYRDDALN